MALVGAGKALEVAFHPAAVAYALISTVCSRVCTIKKCDCNCNCMGLTVTLFTPTQRNISTFTFISYFLLVLFLSFALAKSMPYTLSSSCSM